MTPDPTQPRAADTLLRVGMKSDGTITSIPEGFVLLAGSNGAGTDTRNVEIGMRVEKHEWLWISRPEPSP